MGTEASKLYQQRYQKEYYKKYKALKLAIGKAWRANPENRQKQRDYTKKYYKRTRAERLVYARKYRKENKLAESEKQKLRRKLNRAKYRNAWLMRKYGINLDQYKELLDSQNGQCPICLISKEEHLKRHGRFLYVDHCHQKGKVRGILCDHCNNGLGRFKDNVEFLKRAIEYLQRTNK